VKRLLLAAIAASMAPVGACVLDLSDLTGGPRDGGGGASTSSAAAGGASASGGGSGGGLGPLDCAPCPAGGCAPATVVSGKEAALATGLAVTDEGLYWTSRTGGTVMRLPAGGGPAQVLAKAQSPVAVAVSGVLGSGLAGAGGIVLHGASAFWTEQGDGNQNGNVDMSPKSGGGLVRIASALQLPTAVAADDLYVYWTEADATAGKVRRCPYAAGFCNSPQDLATGLAAPIDLGLAGGRVYWIDEGDGRVLSCPIAGCAGGAPRVHASGRIGLQHLAVGASCVFWTDDVGGGSVSKAPL
jgi:hypothetical protein